MNLLEGVFTEEYIKEIEEMENLNPGDDVVLLLSNAWRRKYWSANTRGESTNC